MSQCARLRFSRARYLPPQTATPPQPNDDGHFDALQDVTREGDVTLSETSQPNNHGHCGGVTLSNPPSAKMETIDIDGRHLKSPPTVLRSRREGRSGPGEIRRRERQVLCASVRRDRPRHGGTSALG
jgi:hypothetical protein